uniref:Lipase, gastric n=1 Tax=Jaculus jaculus TaxID=51337 RepID=A0A8C5L8V5_JACJA
MWLLLTVASLISVLGSTHGFLQKLAPESPEATMNVSQMITYWGYPCEEYEVVTEDGYILGIYRIPYGKKNSENRGRRPVAFLQHGLLASATNWIANLPNNSLAFILADAGYDVWLGNSRGNTWARRNLYYSPDSVEFWAFSFDEMAKYDLPATIDFIVQLTGQEKIHYVGHSQGTTIGEYQLPAFIFQVIFGDKLFFPHNFFEQFLGTEVCSRETLDLLCSNALFIMCGFDIKNLNMSRFDVYLAHNPAGTSVQDALHWAQAAKSGKFQAFNWGSPFQNMLHYNQRTPPYYNVTAMTVPTAVWNGGNDLLADPQDVHMLLPKISNLIYHKEILPYNHLDFIWAMNAPQEVYNEIVSMMNEGEKQF